MEFAEWVVGGLDQYRTGQLPQGQAFFTVVWNRLGTDPRLTAFMNTGDPTGRQALVELIARTLDQDPAFGPALQAAAPDAGAAAGPAKRPFFTSTAGIAALAVVAAAVIGGGVVLATSGGGGDGLVGKLKGTWHCVPTPSEGGAGADSTVAKDITIGDGTWSVVGGKGGWKLKGGTLSLTSSTSSEAIPVTGVPGDYGPIHATAKGTTPNDGNLDITGTASKNTLVLKFAIVGSADASSNGPLFSVTCTRR